MERAFLEEWDMALTVVSSDWWRSLGLRGPHSGGTLREVGPVWHHYGHEMITRAARGCQTGSEVQGSEAGVKEGKRAMVLICCAWPNRGRFRVLWLSNVKNWGLNGWCHHGSHLTGYSHSSASSVKAFLSHHFFSFLVCRVHLALLVPLAKMVLMESLAPLGLLVPVDAQAKPVLL